MDIRPKEILMFLDIANRVAQESYATKLKVGAVFVSEHGIISIGYNGTPSGWSNKCEFITPDGGLKTYDYVSHAEENLFAKIMKQGVSSKNGTIILTHAPCINCAKIILNAGISSVYYQHEYRLPDGIDHLKSGGISVIKI